MQKYLAQVEVIAPNHLERTRCLVKNFLCGPGPKLQQRLLERRQKVANWATDWWLQDMYLSVPLALPINSNPGFVLPLKKKLKSPKDSATFLGRFILELLYYQEVLDRCELEVEHIKSRDGKSQALCMAQHYQMFRMYRRPGVNCDEQIIFDRATSGDHIIVAYHNQFYSIPVRVSDRGRITEAELIEQLLKIMRTRANPKTPPVGILTTAKRPVWACAREELIKNERNRHNIELIERCVCIICIDNDVLPATFNNPYREDDRWIGDRDYANVLHHALHGGGSQHLSANRWFDKTVQFILGKQDGFWCLNYEHSAGEAPAVLPLAEQLTQKVEAMPPAKESFEELDLPAPEKLEWCLSEQTMSDIREASCNFDTLVEDLDLCVLNFCEYSKEFVKSCKISPDVYVQLALQLTYYKLHGKLTATYESAGIRRFSLGRVDVIRAASPEALTWAMAMCQGDPESQSRNQQNNTQDDCGKRPDRIKELFDLAVQRQVKEMNDNITGHGIDNHLMGLRYAAKEAGGPMPEIFTDEAFSIVHHFTLSTSQVTTKEPAVVGYGPVVPDGYGCCYNIQKDSFMFHIAAFNSDDRTNSKCFAQTLEQSLRDMADMLKNSKQR